MSKDPLSQIIFRLERLESAVFGSGSKRSTEKTQKRPPREGLPGFILRLRDQGFFKQPKTAGKVHEKLRSNYHCELDRVAMALLRLQRRKELRKSSELVGQKKQVAYVW